MTALVVISILLGATLALAGIGIPGWLAGRRLTPDTDYTQAWEYLRAKTGTIAPAVTIPAPRRPMGEGVPAPQRRAS